MQKLLKCFNGIVIFASIISSLLVLFKDFGLNLGDSEFTVLFGSSLQNWYKLLDVFQ